MLITWIVSCDEEKLKQEINLDKVFVDTAVAYPGGIYKEWIIHHRLGDYFNSIKIEPYKQQYKLIFEKKDGVSSYWKDLIVRILKICTDAEIVRIS